MDGPVAPAADPLGEAVVGLLRDELASEAPYVILSPATVANAQAAAVAACPHPSR